MTNDLCIMTFVLCFMTYVRRRQIIFKLVSFRATNAACRMGTKIRREDFIGKC
jgi:hypothetical protein